PYVVLFSLCPHPGYSELTRLSSREGVQKSRLGFRNRHRPHGIYRRCPGRTRKPAAPLYVPYGHPFLHISLWYWPPSALRLGSGVTVESAESLRWEGGEEGVRSTCWVLVLVM
ncbi:unnamed protein product, partial [Ectocarpus sp. 13 AM-2016]